MIEIKDYSDINFPDFLNREVYVFPNLDGLKTKIWLDKNDQMHMSNHNVEIFLTEEETVRNKVFIQTLNSESLLKFFKENRYYSPQSFENSFDYIIEGIWLYPSYVDYDKKYRKKFFITDVIKRIESYNRTMSEKINLYSYLHYFSYLELLSRYKLNICPLILKNKFTIKELKDIARRDKTFVERNQGIGAGIIIKNYIYYDLNNKQIFARIRNEENRYNRKEMRK